MSVPAVRRVVVGVDGSAESAAALRWACREASLRGAEVHAVHVREANCHSLASYAAAASPNAEDDTEEMWRSVLPDQSGTMQIRTEVVEGLAPRVLLDRCADADMLVLGTASDVPGSSRVAVQLAGMLGILDTQFVVKRISQLARRARDRGGRGPGPGTGPGGGPAGGPQDQGYGGQTARGPAGPALHLRNPVFSTERELLKLALQRPELVAPAFDAYGTDEFTAPPYAMVRQCIDDAGGAEHGCSDVRDYLSRVREVAPDDGVRKLVTELAVEVFRGKTIDELYAGQQLVQVRIRAVDRRIRDVTSALTRLGNGGDPAQYAAVQNELWVLQQYGQALRNHGAAAL